MKKTSISMVISSAEIIGNNPDLLTQILLRIPTKPLLKFKCVSKQWLSLLSCPDFCFSHTRHHGHQSNGSLTPTALLLGWDFHPSSSENHLVSLKHSSTNTIPLFDCLNVEISLKVLQSCNGLFLCCAIYQSKYFICNPTTKKFKELSFPVIPENQKSITFHLFLAFDPLKSPHYKIVRLWEASPSSTTEYQYLWGIYSSDTDSWSESRFCFNLKTCIMTAGPVFCNGKLYLKHIGERELLCLDVENESLEPIRVALPISMPGSLIDIGECRGVLHLAVTSPYTRTGFELKMFEMKHDCSGWLLKHHLRIGRSEKGFYKLFQGHGRNRCYFYDEYYHRFYDISITQFEKEEEPKIFVSIKNKVIFYDFEDGAWKFLCDFERKSLNYLFNYYENLSSV